MELYADFEHAKLLPFLQQSSNYRLDAALRLCEQRRLYPEMVFVLGRMGNARQALALLLEQMRDVPQAMAFCQSQVLLRFSPRCPVLRGPIACFGS